jgi:outer membrane protein
MLRCAVWLVSGLLSGLVAGPVVAQASAGADSTGPELSLEDALRIAQRNNPLFLQSVDARRASSAAVRSAYGGLLPQLTASLGATYQQGGQEIFNGFSLGAPSNTVQSEYQFGLTYQLSGATLLAPSLARAHNEAAEADVAGQLEVLQTSVAQQYLTVLQTRARADLNDSLAADAQAQLELAQARVAVGSATPIDVRKAEVALGQQQVQAIQAHNQVDIEKLRLFQQMGVSQPAGARLITQFAVTPPPFTLDSVLTLARQANPQLAAVRARERAADLDVRRTRALYAPTLGLSTGIGGYTYQYTDANFAVQQALAVQQQQFTLCTLLDTVAGSQAQACGSPSLTAAQIAAIRSNNRQFPFRFTNTPRQFAAVLSLPLFDGFAREQRVEQAAAGRSDARYTVRARELQVTADVTSAYLTLVTAGRTARLQEDNAARARDELTLAEERYRVGAGAFIDVTDARASYERAQNDRINAVYDYHKAFAALEAAVGRPLRSGK